MTDIVERLRFDVGSRPGGVCEAAANEIERLRDAIKRQAAAAKTGMDAATRISSVQLEQARIARAESSPDAIDSERDANAMLTNEIERLRAELAEAKVDAERYRLELRFIANADPKQWDAEVRDQFQQWAQSRAREAIDATLAEEARTRK